MALFAKFNSSFHFSRSRSKASTRESSAKASSTDIERQSVPVTKSAGDDKRLDGSIVTLAVDELPAVSDEQPPTLEPEESDMYMHEESYAEKEGKFDVAFKPDVNSMTTEKRIFILSSAIE